MLSAPKALVCIIPCRTRKQLRTASGRIYFLQQWFSLSDPGVEEALYDSAMNFAGIHKLEQGRCAAGSVYDP
jgi:hypothetical protein